MAVFVGLRQSEIAICPYRDGGAPTRPAVTIDKPLALGQYVAFAILAARQFRQGRNWGTMRFGRKRSEAAAVIRSLRPFVFTRQTLPPVAVPVSQEILPGLLLAPVVAQGTRIDFLPPESIELLGGTKAVLDCAIRNLGIHPRPQVVPFEATPGDPDTTCYGLGSEDVFAASAIAGLDLLTAIVAPEVPPRHGILVAVPYWRLVLLHVLRGHGGLASLSRIAQMTDEMFRSGGIPSQEQLSSDVFYIAPDGRVQIVSRTTSTGPVVETRGLISEFYFRPTGVLGPEEQ